MRLHSPGTFGAAKLQDAESAAKVLGRDPHLEVETVEGHYGEFTVLVEGEEVIRGGPLGFVGVLPSVRKVLRLVRAKSDRGEEQA